MLMSTSRRILSPMRTRVLPRSRTLKTSGPPWEVGRHEYDAGAVSGRTIEALRADGALAPDGFRIIWSSPGYSHCCFTAHSDMDPALVEKITQTFVAIDAQDPAGKAVLEGEGCSAFVPGVTTGWETLEKAAEQASILCPSSGFFETESWVN